MGRWRLREGAEGETAVSIGAASTSNNPSIHSASYLSRPTQPTPSKHAQRFVAPREPRTVHVCFICAGGSGECVGWRPR
eukprot:4908203-Pyramimonas_sp.AAC.1